MNIDPETNDYVTTSSDNGDQSDLWESAAFYTQFSVACSSSSSLSGDSSKTTITILFSETGMSLSFAGELSESLSKNASHISIKQIDDFNIQSLMNQKNILLIVTSTVGKRGDPPKSAQKFWQNLQQQQLEMMNLSEKLSQLYFAVFGLSCRASQKFAAFPVNLDNVLFSLNATRLQPVVVGHKDAFDQWSRAITDSIVNLFQTQTTDSAVPELIPEFESMESFDINSITASSKSLPTTRTNSSSSAITVLSESKSSFMIRGGNTIQVQDALSRIHENLNIIPMKIVSRVCLLPKKNVLGQQIILIRMTVSDDLYSTFLDFEPGDCLGVFPSNLTEDVDFVLSRVPDKVNCAAADDSFVLIDPLVITNNRRLPVCSLREALTHYLDIYWCPSQEFLRMMSSFTRARLHLERMMHLAEEHDAYESWKKSDDPTFCSVLRDFTSLMIPPEVLLANLPLLQPRLYSICSSRFVYPTEIDLAVNLGRWSKRGVTGICSSFLSSVSGNTNIPCFFQSLPNFKMPQDLKIPIIMIASGLGIAPFRSFLQERQKRLQVVKLFSVKRRTSSKESLICKISHLGRNNGTVDENTDQGKIVVGEMILFYGCKNHKVDALFRSEINDWIADETLSYFFLVSADGGGNQKKHIEDDVWLHRDLIYSLVKFEEATIYVSGDERTLMKIRQKLANIFPNDLNHASSSQSAIHTLRRQGQYFENCISVQK